MTVSFTVDAIAAANAKLPAEIEKNVEPMLKPSHLRLSRDPRLENCRPLAMLNLRGFRIFVSLEQTHHNLPDKGFLHEGSFLTGKP